MDKSSSEFESWEFWIDVGGTFTDCLARSPDGSLRRQKLLSSGLVPGSICSLASGGFCDNADWQLPDEFWQGALLVVDPPGGEGRFETRVNHFVAQQGQFELADRLPDWVLAGTPYHLLPGLEAPLLAIRQVLGVLPDDLIPDCSVRLGTTRGTNALVTRSGPPRRW